MTLDQFNALANVIAFCVAPCLVILDVAFGILRLRWVIRFCNTAWRTLARLPLPTLIARLPAETTALFNIMYGPKHLSRTCFGRSVFSSLAAIALVFFVSNGVDVSGIGSRNAFDQLASAFSILGRRLHCSAWLLALVVLAAHLLLDYVSLLETRWVLSQLGRATVLRTLFLTTLDYVASTLIWVYGFLGLVSLGNFIGGPNTVPFARVDSWHNLVFFPFSIIHEYFSAHSLASGSGVPVGHIIGLLSFSTYFTSIVFYSFAVTSIVLRFTDRTRRRLAILLRLYARSKKRLRPATLVAIALGALAKSATVLLQFVKAMAR